MSHREPRRPLVHYIDLRLPPFIGPFFSSLLATRPQLGQEMDYPRRTVDSLVSLCIDYAVKNLHMYLGDISSVKLLPPLVKDRMLRKFTSSSFFWARLDFKKALQALIHPQVARIDLSLANIDDEILEILSESRNFKDLYLTKQANTCLSTHSVINFLSTLKHLYLLQISNCIAVNDDVLISVSKNCHMLAGLDVGGCKNITDVAMEALSEMEHLVWLTFSSTQVTNKGIEMLAGGPSGPLIKELRLANCDYITGDILHAIIQYCPNIEVLVFYNLQPSEIGARTYFPFNEQEESLKNLKQLTWTVQW